MPGMTTGGLYQTCQNFSRFGSVECDPGVDLVEREVDAKLRQPDRSGGIGRLPVPRPFARLAPEHAGRSAFRVNDHVAQDGRDRLVFVNLVRLIPTPVIVPWRHDLEHYDRSRDGDRAPV